MRNFYYVSFYRYVKPFYKLKKYFIFISISTIQLLVSANLKGQNIENIAKQKPFNLTGSLNINAGYYHSDNGNNRYNPFNWFLSGSPVLNLYGISFPFTFAVSDQNTSFSQPFNQYGVSPTYKWITAHIGYRNINFSNYTLGGANFLGGGIELNPGKLRFGFIGGRFQKAVEEVTTGSFQPIPAYERWGYAAKIGWGTEQYFIDLTGFKGKDDPNSLSPESLGNSGITPSENVSIGIKSSATIQKFTFNLDAAMSAFTKDITDTETIAADSNRTFIKSLVEQNGTTIGRIAGETSLSYTENKWGIKLKYKRIEPDFKSLGAYYFQTDIQQITISPSIKLLKKKLRINASLGIQNDDLLKTHNVKTKRTISSLSANYNHNSFFSAGINYSNYGTSQQSGKLQLNDSIKLSVVLVSYGGYINLNKTKDEKSWNLSLNINKSNFIDNNIVTKALTQTDAFISSIAFSYSPGSKGISINSGINRNRFKSSADTSYFWGPTLGASYQIPKQKITIAANVSLNFKKSHGEKDGHYLNFSSSANYAINDHHSLGVNVAVNKNTSSSISSIYSLNEQQINFTYGYLF